MVEEKKFGIVGLTAIVFGSMIGSGIFNIVQNMSAGASAGAVIISWLITALGMIGLVLTFKVLSSLRPDLNAGIYQYGAAGFGKYIGFNLAWGYWLCTSFANVAYAVMLKDSFAVFFPELLSHRIPSMIFGTCLIWTMFLLVVRGIHGASIVNTAITALKIASLFLIVAILVLFFSIKQFAFDFWGQASGLGSIVAQVRCTMLVTLWCFIGIEGAVMMSARAKRSSDVGRASIFGFLLAWVLYVLMSVLAFGVMSQTEMSDLANPSVAYLLLTVCGEWAYYFVIISVIVSLLGGWVAWTLITAQVPYEAAEIGIMPKHFLKLNSRGVPTYGLFLASVIMQVFYICVLFAHAVYMVTIEISGMMVLPAYLFSGLFLWRATYHKRTMLHLPGDRRVLRLRMLGIFCSLYCLWLLYAAGLELVLLSSLFYLPGVYFYIRARHEHGATGRFASRRLFTPKERWVFAILCVAAIASVVIMSTKMHVL